MSSRNGAVHVRQAFCEPYGFVPPRSVGALVTLHHVGTVLKTDHYAVIINIDDNTMDTRKLKWDFKNTDWIEWKNEIENTFKDWSKDLPVDIMPDDTCKSYTDNIINCTNNIIPKKVVCNHSKPKN